MLRPYGPLSCLANLCIVVQTMSPGQLLTPNTIGMSPHAHLLRYAAGRDAPSTPLPHNGEYGTMLWSVMPCSSAAPWLCTTLLKSDAGENRFPCHEQC